MADIPGDITTKAVLDAVNGASLATFSGELEIPGDHDWIQVSLFDGVTYEFFLCFLETGSLINGNASLTLRDSTGAVVVSADDGGVGQNSLLTFSPGSSGQFFLDIGASGDNSVGSYSLVSLNTFAGEVLQTLTDGNDDYTGLVNERIVGGKGADRIDIGAGVDCLGEQGNDILIGNNSQNKIYGGLGNDTIVAGGGTDVIFGDAGDDDLFCGAGNEDVRGGPGDDAIFGESGIDFMRGGPGKDFLTGGADNDFFIFDKVNESPKGAGRDVIFDFSVADDNIDLRDIDAKKGGVDNEFKLIGTAAFHDKAGELRFVKINLAGTLNDKTIVQGDVNGDGRADFHIQLNGLHNLTLDNFLL